MIVLMLSAFGLILGNFVNALVWRLHERKNWTTERSECTHCHHILGPLDLIPVISWVLLRGKCRYCRHPIDDSPWVELALPVLFVASYSFWPWSLEGSAAFVFMLWLVFLVGFLALAVYDLRWFLLPNTLVFPLIGLAAVQIVTVTLWEGDWRVLLGAGAGAIIISGIFYLLFQASKGTWIGGGDVKLGIALGLLAGGVMEAFLLLFIASALGMIAALPMLVRGKAGRKTQLPFGPLLIAGLIVVKLFGSAMISWYAGLFYV